MHFGVLFNDNMLISFLPSPHRIAIPKFVHIFVNNKRIRKSETTYERIKNATTA
jgi:hypothetical protein